MRRRIKIERVSTVSIVVASVLAILFTFICALGLKEFNALQVSTERYLTCEAAAKQLKEGSDYLTEQVRLYVLTGEAKYREQYLEEVNVTKRRERALEKLERYFNGSHMFEALKEAMDYSEDLMNTEYYAMRLRAEAEKESPDTWPEEIKAVTLTAEDEALSPEEKMLASQRKVCDDAYQKARTDISGKVTECLDNLSDTSRNDRGRTVTIFKDMYKKLVLGIAILIVLLLTDCILVRKLIVNPLLSYNESIVLGEIFPVIGAAELQNLAQTYNKVYQENRETQSLLQHKAEHDPLTDLLNRGSFERILQIHEEGDSPFAMILVDVDVFKSVNDTYGHASGDTILVKVSGLLTKAFRSIDYICRIGGDEFAIIMVEMTTELKYTIEDKIAAINEELSHPTDGLPAVSLSVGIAFTDRKNPGESIFKDADKALYYVKEHGRCGCAFYGENTESN